MNSSNLQSNRRLIVVLFAGVFTVAILLRLGQDLFRGELFSWKKPEPKIETLAQIKRVLIVSIDGCRPDLLLRANCPHVRSLIDRGAFSMWARTTEMSITLPSHTSMITGVRPDIHKITWNYYIPRVYPEAATIFEQAHLAHLTTGMVAGKSKFNELNKPGSLDYVEVYRDGEGADVEIGESAADMIRRHAPRVMFVHLPNVDSVGHAVGWGTPQQIRAVEHADEAVGIILDALARADMTSETLIILSADHGGQGWGHGPNDPRSRHIPWICAGPGIKKNFDLARYGNLVINTEDTFATACTLMNIPLPQYIDGKFVEQATDSNELLTLTSTPTATKKPEPYDPWWEPPSYKWERTVIPDHHN